MLSIDGVLCLLCVLGKCYWIINTVKLGSDVALGLSVA